MSAPQAEPVFELERFSAAPVSGDVAIVEVDGRFADGALNGEPPRLLVERPRGDRVELPALAPVGDPDGRWHASFAVPADRLTGASFALALRDLLLDLPAPDTSGADGDRLVALARELNALRRDLDLARERAAAADARLATATEEAQADKDRALGESAALMEAALREARERGAAELATARKAVEAAQAKRDALCARAEEAEGQRDAVADELRDARRSQKTLRADLEAMRRERDALARELEKALKVIPKGHESPDPPEEGSGPEIERGQTLKSSAADVSAPRIHDDATVRVERTAIQPTPDDPVESVRVIGRQGPRRVSPADTLPPVDAELPAPQVVRWVVASIVFVLFVVVLTLIAL